MKTIEQLTDELLQREGGYVNNSADKGGPTRFGITEAVARASGYRGDMQDYPLDEAREIYLRQYWRRPGFDQVATIDYTIAAELFDTGVNMGVGTAAIFLQRLLTALNRNGKDYPDLVPDGKIGPATLEALKAYRAARGLQGFAVLLKGLEGLQAERYVKLAEMRPTNETFLYGWLANRIGQ